MNADSSDTARTAPESAVFAGPPGGPPDLLVALSCASALLNLFALGDLGGAWWRAPLVVVGVAGAAVVWWLRRRAGRRGGAETVPAWNSVAFAAVVGVSFFATDGIVQVPLLLVAVLLLVLDHGLVVGAGFAALVLLGSAAIMIVAYDRTVLFTLAQAVLLALLFGFGLAYAELVGRLRRARDDRARAVDDLGAANAALRAANDELRRSAALERDLVLAQERARAARELHDGLGHRLTVVAMSLDFAERMHERDPARAWQEVHAAREQTAAAITHMRQWVRALHPAEVGHLADAAAFDAIAESFRGTGLDVRVEQTGPTRSLPRQVSLLCHRLVQEGLTNVLRHARAGQVLISVDFLPGQLRVRLRDDGVGAADLTEGFGLRSLRERADALGGRLDVRSEPGTGTTLTVLVPAAEGDAAAAGNPAVSEVVSGVVSGADSGPVSGADSKAGSGLAS